MYLDDILSSPLCPPHGQVGALEGVYHFALAEEVGEHMPERTAALAVEDEVPSNTETSLPAVLPSLPLILIVNA